MAINVSVVMTVMSLVLLTLIIAVRWWFGIQAHRTERFRHHAEPLVASFVSGRSTLAEVKPFLASHPQEALALLMEVSARSEAEGRNKLVPLFACLPMQSGLREGLKSCNWEKRLPAAERLGYLGDHATGDDLIAALRDDVLVVRFAAARSLVAMRSAEAVEPILLAFDVPGEMNERRTAEILSELGPAAVTPLLEVLDNPGKKYSESVLNVATRVLGMLRAQAAVTPLTSLLAHSEFRVRLNAVRALSAIGDPKAMPDIAKLANDPAWEVRNMVMQAAGKLRYVDFAPALSKALADPAWWVRFSAAQSLFLLGESGIRSLRDATTGATDRYASDMSRQVLEEHGIAINRISA